MSNPSIENNISFFQSKSLDTKTLKLLVNSGRDINIFIVWSLGKSSYIKEAYTNQHIIKNYKKSDIGEQIGYISMTSGNLDRDFTNDLGMEPDRRYNNHLVFTTKELAEAYLVFSKTDEKMLQERKEYLEECDRWNSAVDDFFSESASESARNYFF